MKVLLMHRDRDFNPNIVNQQGTTDLVKDLQLDILFTSMAAGDPFLLQLAKGAILASLLGAREITYRQDILADCLEHPATLRELYSLSVEAIEGERRVWGLLSSRYAEGALHRATEVLEVFQVFLRRLRQIADANEPIFRSQGFLRFFKMIREELDDSYLETVREYSQQLQFSGGVLISAAIGMGGKGADYTLRRPSPLNTGWLDRMHTWTEALFSGNEERLTYEVDPRDEAGFRALSDLRVQGIRHVARALTQSTDHILGFFKSLRTELGFYIGCLNLHDRLAEKQESICFPHPLPATRHELQCQALYDVCLSLGLPGRVVGNDVSASGKSLIVITGANRGGKSTFLRSVGIAQLMMQCGMFVPADEFRANICTGIDSHFKREEDAGMKSGKLDEELARMSTMVDHIRSGSMVLFNESFASTNEREGAQIAREIVKALLEAGIKIFYVTHMFELSSGFYQANIREALFLRAERLSDETRTFRLLEGAPLPTSYGEDLYQQIFSNSPPPVQNAADCGSPETEVL